MGLEMEKTSVSFGGGCVHTENGLTGAHLTVKTSSRSAGFGKGILM